MRLSPRTMVGNRVEKIVNLNCLMKVEGTFVRKGSMYEWIEC